MSTRTPPHTVRHPVPTRDARDARDAPTPERVIVAGFIASAVMLFAFALAYGAALLAAAAVLAGRPGGTSAVDVLGQWLYGLTDNALIDLARPNLGIAVTLYFLGGLAWAALYAYVARPLLGGPEWRRGLVFAVVPWLFSLLVFFPLIGGGPLGLALGAGPLPIVGNLILHAVYGLTLSAVYGPYWQAIPDADASMPTRADLTANRGAHVGTAFGLFAGMVAGGAVGLAGSGASPAGWDPAVIPLAGALLGGAVGALAGSFLGLGAGETRGSPAPPTPPS